MKKVLFICLLSLTTCLSRPDNTQGAAAPVPLPPNSASAPVSPSASPNTPSSASPTITPPATAAANQPAPPASPVTPKETTPVVTPQNAQPAPTAGQTTIQPSVAPANETKTNATENESNKTTDKKNNTEGAADGKVEPPKTPATNDTDKSGADKKPASPEDKDKKESTTPKADMTTKPAAVPAKHVEASGRGFDGPSFLGGMILTLGLLAIGFMGFKYYRNQTERNYHTL